MDNLMFTYLHICHHSCFPPIKQASIGLKKIQVFLVVIQKVCIRGGYISFKTSLFVLLSGSLCCVKGNEMYDIHRRRQTRARARMHGRKRTQRSTVPLWPCRFWDDITPAIGWAKWPHSCWHKSAPDRPSANSDGMDVISYCPTVRPGVWPYVCLCQVICVWITAEERGQFVVHWRPRSPLPLDK